MFLPLLLVRKLANNPLPVLVRPSHLFIITVAKLSSVVYLTVCLLSHTAARVEVWICLVESSIVTTMARV